MDRRDFIKGALAVPVAAALPAFVAAAQPLAAAAAPPQFAVTTFEALGHFDDGMFVVDEWLSQRRETYQLNVSPTA
jgi:hypothetical protein